MKARLIRKNGKMYLLCNDGSIAIADESILKQLFVCFNSVETIKGTDGQWKENNNSDIEKVSGKTLVWVDDNNCLCIKENPFTSFFESIVDNEYITLHEYALLHGKNDNRIKALCREGRISGATKKAGKWFVPKHSPYPADARYSGIEK